MKLVVALALAPVASALVAPSAPAASKTVLAESKQDLVDLQNSLAGPPGFYDPLGLADMSFALGMEGNANGGVGQEATIGWLRHSEIKHGRIAMAAFLGFIAQCTPLVSGEHKFLPYRGYVAGCTPQEQWDNIPLYGKLQIFVLVGMLESYGEGASQPDGYVPCRVELAPDTSSPSHCSARRGRAGSVSGEEPASPRRRAGAASMA